MKAGNVKEFINNLTIQDEMVRYKDKLYYFYGIRYDSERDIYYTSIDKFGTDIYHFEEEFYCYESKSSVDCPNIFFLTHTGMEKIFIKLKTK